MTKKTKHEKDINETTEELNTECENEACQCNPEEECATEENSEITALEEQVKNLKDQLLRNAAELENFKRRTNEERMRETKYRAQSLVTNIIPAIDNFERALAATVEDEATSTFLTGFKMIHNQIVEALTQEGVEAIKTEGEVFDPNVHQAVMQEAASGVESGMVLAELQKGYKLKDRVIRPAMVKVSE